MRSGPSSSPLPAEGALHTLLAFPWHTIRGLGRLDKIGQPCRYVEVHTDGATLLESRVAALRVHLHGDLLGRVAGDLELELVVVEVLERSEHGGELALPRRCRGASRVRALAQHARSRRPQPPAVDPHARSPLAQREPPLERTRARETGEAERVE